MTAQVWEAPPRATTVAYAVVAAGLTTLVACGRGGPTTADVRAATGTPKPTQADPTAPSPPNVFGVTASDNQGATFNVALVRDIVFQDVEVHADVRAISGKEDRGGGVVWRAQGPQDYYIARWNPLEDNYRVYVVQEGTRRELGSAKTPIDRRAWHRVRVTMRGEKIECYLDDALYLTVSDSTFSAAGAVGLWTKADAATWFDDFEVAPAPR